MLFGDAVACAAAPDRWPRLIAVGDLGQAEVQNLGVAALGDENVRGLDVAVNDSLGMRGVESVGDLDAETQKQLSSSSGRLANACA